MGLSAFVHNSVIGNGEKEAKPVKEFGFERVSLILKQHYGKLIGVNLLFILCCLPIVTIPAAYAGLHRVILNWVRSNNRSVTASFFEEFKTDFLKRTVTGLLLIISPFSLAFYPEMLGMRTLALAVFIISAVLCFCFTSYFYPLIVMVDVPISKNLKNAFIMMIRYRRETLVMLFSAGLFYALLIIYTLYSAPLFIVIMFAFNCLICCSYFNKAFIDCFENEQEKGRNVYICDY